MNSSQANRDRESDAVANSSQANLIFDDTKNKVAWDSIPECLSESCVSWIQGNVHMIFPKKQKARCILSNRFARKLQVSIICRDWSLFDFRIGQGVQLGLKGATLEKKQSSAPGFMPFSLVFSEGASARFADSEGTLFDGEVVDTWSGTLHQAIST